jgi:hypothetical protein
MLVTTVEKVASVHLHQTQVVDQQQGVFLFVVLGLDGIASLQDLFGVLGQGNAKVDMPRPTILLVQTFVFGVDDLRAGPGSTQAGKEHENKAHISGNENGARKPHAILLHIF